MTMRKENFWYKSVNTKLWGVKEKENIYPSGNEFGSMTPIWVQIKTPLFRSHSLLFSFVFLFSLSLALTFSVSLFHDDVQVERLHLLDLPFFLLIRGNGEDGVSRFLSTSLSPSFTTFSFSTLAPSKSLCDRVKGPSHLFQANNQRITR